jgi:long-chain acyl-CoA synthetase
MDKEVNLHGQPWNASNLAEMFLEMASAFQGMTALNSHSNKDSVRESLTYDELIGRSLAIADGLIEAGLQPGDRVMLLADNRLEWLVSSMSITFSGAIDVPRGNDATSDEINYILSHSASCFLIVENQFHLDRVFRILDDPDGPDRIVVMDSSDLTPEELDNPNITTLDELYERGMKIRSSGKSKVKSRIGAIKPVDPYTMIYTSGTTGRPKGVVLSHANMMSQVLNVPIQIKPGWKVLSILPVWHSYERVFEMLAIARGIEMTYSSVKTIGADMKTVRPHIMVSAPRLWENVYSRVYHNIRSSGILKRALFKMAYGFAFVFRLAAAIFTDQYLELRYVGLFERFIRKAVALVAMAISFLPFWVLDKLVFRKLRDVIGGRFVCTVSGGGALPMHIDRFFSCIGVRVLEGYGMTESCPVLSVRRFEKLVIGTVGPIYPGTEVRIIDLDTEDILYPNPGKPHSGRGLKGEIHVKGPQVMEGYFRSPEETAKVIHDGWLNTGDLGMITFNDCLKILGRTKDTIVLLSGENIEPVPIENRIRSSELVENCMVVGQDQKYLGLLVVPSTEGFLEHDASLNTMDRILKSKEAKAMMNEHIHEAISRKTGFKAYERIHSWRWIEKSFVVGDEVTSTFKIKRHVVGRKYKPIIESMFTHDAKKR